VGSLLLGLFELARQVLHLALKLPDAVVSFDQRVFVGLYQPRLLHVKVLGGPLPLLPQLLLDFVGLVGLKASDLVLQFVVEAALAVAGQCSLMN
jgi:hypothetical protein